MKKPPTLYVVSGDYYATTFQWVFPPIDVAQQIVRFGISTTLEPTTEDYLLQYGSDTGVVIPTFIPSTPFALTVDNRFSFSYVQVAIPSEYTELFTIDTFLYYEVSVSLVGSTTQFTTPLTGKLVTCGDVV